MRGRHVCGSWITRDETMGDLIFITCLYIMGGTRYIVYIVYNVHDG
jgi:hypothetical protein